MRDKGNILIIAKVMLPYTSSFGSCQRIYYLSNYLVEKGFHVTVMAEKTGNVNKGLNAMERKYESHWLEGKPYFGVGILNTGLAKKVSGIIFNEIYENTAFQHYMWRVVNTREILRFIKKRKIQTVIISGPYFSVFGLCGKIKQRYNNVKVVLDYRDPWNLWNDGHGIASILESRCIRKSDKVVCFSDDFKSDMQKRFPTRQGKYEVVYNGYYEKIWKEIEIKQTDHKRMVFKYIGGISFPAGKDDFRNPKALIDAFLSVCIDRDMELQFIGVGKLTREMRMVEQKSKHKIRFCSPVSVAESLRQMTEGDVLISIHDAGNQSDQYILSAKLFDYLRSGKVIVNIGKEGSALSSFIKKRGVGFSCENQRTVIEKKLLWLYALWQNNGGVIERENRKFDCSIYGRDYQNEHYRKLIERL
ncbi:MAG: glycosyltransferase family 4 protein [Lachnospiraceae bacterium]|nr:glycosyltransferase family 4 protein [Lachnospiraceae bacterium]